MCTFRAEREVRVDFAKQAVRVEVFGNSYYKPLPLDMGKRNYTDMTILSCLMLPILQSDNPSEVVRVKGPEPLWKKVTILSAAFDMCVKP